MKKKTYIIITIIITIFLISFFTQTYAKVYQNQNKKLIDILEDPSVGDTEAVAETELKEYGYEGNIQDEMVWDAKITVYVDSTAFNNTSTNSSKKYWNVKIGNKQVESGIKFSEVQTRYACELQEPSQVNANTSFDYDAVLIAKNQSDRIGNKGIRINLKEVFTGNDITTGRNRQNNAANTSQNTNTGTNNANTNNNQNNKKKKTSLIEKILGPIVVKILDIAKAFPDVFQMICNMLVTSSYNTGAGKIFPWRITYSYSDMESDQNKNQYVNVTQGQETYAEDDTRHILDPIDGDELGFTADTEIPIIPVEFYNLGYGNIGFLDINFFKVNTDLHASDSFWIKIRNFFSILMHIILFLSSALLISILVIRGIRIVWGSLTPTEKKEEKEGINDFIVALAMLVGSVAIMVLLIYFNNIFYGNNTSMEFPLRVSVTGSANYNFSTNITGYFRYMTETEKVDELWTKFINQFFYTIMVSFNMFLVGIMIFRMFYLMLLSFMIPIKCVGYALGKKELFGMTYSKWVTNYAKGVAIQLVISFGYALISKFAIIVTS